MKKKNKVTDKEWEAYAKIVRKSEQLDCIHKLETLVCQLEAVQVIDKLNGDEDAAIVLGVRFAIDRLKGNKLGDYNE